MITNRGGFSRISQDENGNIKDDSMDDFECCGSKKCCNMYPFELINIIAALAHLASFVTMIIIYVDLDVTPYQYTETFISWNRAINGTCPDAGCNNISILLNTTNDGQFCIGPETSVIEDSSVDVGLLIIFFHVLSFVFQGAAGLTQCCQNGFLGFKYVEEIRKGRNLLRFVEYAFSASIMLVAIAFLNGVTDINLVASICVLTAATQLCGLVAEFLFGRSYEEQQDIYFYFGLVSHVTAWMQFFCAYGVIFHAFLRSATNDPDIQPPAFVYWIVWIIFCLYGVFGAVQLTEIFCYRFSCALFKDNKYVRVKNRCNYQCKEMSYVILSLASKLFLGWMIFSSVLFRSED